MKRSAGLASHIGSDEPRSASRLPAPIRADPARLESAGQHCGVAEVRRSEDRLRFRTRAACHANEIAVGQSSLSYFPKMFFPHPNFVPIVTRTLLRPPSSRFEKKL